MNFQAHFKKNLILASPVMLTQAGQILVNVADNVMVGRLGGKNDIVQNKELGEIALGAVSISNAVFFSFFVLAMGFSFALVPLIAENDAKNKFKEGKSFFEHSLLLNIIVGIILSLLVTMLLPGLKFMVSSDAVYQEAMPYLSIVTVSIIPMMIFQSLRQLSEGLSYTVPVLIATLLANIINIFLNYVLIYGQWGFPRMEVQGAAWGTFISRVFMVFFMLGALLLWKKSKLYLEKINFKQLVWSKFYKLMSLGTPIALSMFFEVTAFGIAAFICEKASTIDLAAHQIALNLASITFMLCTGLAVAASIRVGNQFGLKDKEQLKMAGYSNMLMAFIFMMLCGIFFIIFRHELVALYIDKEDIIALAGSLMIIAALFQLSDGLQVVTLGALRGMQDVWTPFFITFVSYWVIGIPLGYYLTIPLKMGAWGMWCALGISLTISATALILRFRYKTNRLNFK